MGRKLGQSLTKEPHPRPGCALRTDGLDRRPWRRGRKNPPHLLMDLPRTEGGGGGGGEEEATAIEAIGEEELEGLVSRFARIHQPVPFSLHPPKLKFNLEWRDINYKVVVPVPPKNFALRLLFKLPIPAAITNYFRPRREVPILNHVSGRANTGELLAIMGPSGSGKTTLLNVLARRIKRNLTGQVLVNGEEVTGRRFKRRMAYVLQDDIFFPFITVRNTVRDAAYLKLPQQMSWKEKNQRVEEILTELGLQRCANTIVGGTWVRGVSGGERKRTNIATEIVSGPGLLFVDEPTSGLDAASSLGLVVSLKTLAKSGHTVVATIHQPSSAMFMLFDKVLLLAEGGWVVYYGSPQEVFPYFRSLGLEAPPHYNPADFMLEVVSSQEKTPDGRTARQLLIDSYADQAQRAGETQPLKITEEERESVKDMMHGPKFPTPFYLQTIVLARRAFFQRKGDLLSWDRIFQILFITLIAGFIFIDRNRVESQIPDYSGVLFFSTFFWVLHTWFNSLYAFPPERAVITKERATGSYRLSAYFMGKQLAETPLELVLPIVFACIIYWMVNLVPNAGCFIFFIFEICLYALLGSGFGLLIGAAVVDVKKAVTFSTILVLTSILLGGFFIRASNMKPWVRWSRWISFVKYTYELSLLNQFRMCSPTFAPTAGSTTFAPGPITGEEILTSLGVETNIWGDLMFVIGMIVLTRILAYLALRFLHKPKA